MTTLLEMAKNIHPTHTLSEEELASRYIEIHRAIRSDIEFFIQASPNDSSPLFISGQIGSGKTTFLKSLLLDEKNFPVDYFDLSELEVETPFNALEVSLVILKQIFHLSNPTMDTSIIDTFISNTRKEYDFSFKEIDMKRLLKEYDCKKSTVIIDGLDRLLELSTIPTIDQILFDYAFIWKLLKQKLIFVTPLHWVLYEAALSKYEGAYSPPRVGSLQFHILLPSPHLMDRSFWDAFLDKRAKVGGLKLTRLQKYKLIRLSGGVMRSMLINIHRLINLMYRDGASCVEEKYLKELELETLLPFEIFSESLRFNRVRRKALDEVLRNSPPLSDMSLCLNNPPMVIVTKEMFSKKEWWRTHPLLERFLPDSAIGV
jgi:hypothetical protein